MPSHPLPFAAIAAATLLVACGGGSEDSPESRTSVSEETRLHDSRTSFVVVPFDNTTTYPDYEAGAGGKASFTALTGTTSSGAPLPETDRWMGVHNGAAYRIEVPKNWNGKLVMYAHGYRGTHNNLTVSNPRVRRYLVENGYAWAASSYSKNWYDVRAGVEDTNALANEFSRIAAANDRPLPAPTKTYITGHSMGGHITAAAIEEEAQRTAINKRRYDGAVPMCGVTGDMAHFDTRFGMQVAAQALAGVPSYPTHRWSEILPLVNEKLWISAPAPNGATVTPTAGAGEHFVSVVKNLTGGERPLFQLAMERGGSFHFNYSGFGTDGTVNGILNKSGVDTNRFTYTVDGNPAASKAINDAALKITAPADANRLRSDGLRWVPVVNGEFSVPVVSIHTLGDLFVPFNMIQEHRKRAEAKGNGDRLVTRAIRGIAHCDFTVAEEEEAFDAMVKWEAGGAKPAGDDVITPATVAASNFGCAFTRPAVQGVDSANTIRLRTMVADNGGSCPAQ